MSINLGDLKGEFGKLVHSISTDSHIFIDYATVRTQSATAPLVDEAAHTAFQALQTTYEITFSDGDFLWLTVFPRNDPKNGPKTNAPSTITATRTETETETELKKSTLTRTVTKTVIPGVTTIEPVAPEIETETETTTRTKTITLADGSSCPALTTDSADIAAQQIGASSAASTQPVAWIAATSILATLLLVALAVMFIFWRKVKMLKGGTAVKEPHNNYKAGFAELAAGTSLGFGDKKRASDPYSHAYAVELHGEDGRK
ncbi:hypothetical protein BJ508DRAFT_112402 [Ascobolus immersus RN42]|uniref:Uncharacterized protein n=1 Tax=Ascobolus immersus RN42 TaxID=1160509 RepID=A0A3N4I9W3_ASCIM|nr:hypothetical protein BJ508DRAFT_112402 [Ascobolus immersus RN42]